MLSFKDLRQMAKERVEDAKVLKTAGRHNGAVYIAGYAVEYMLKARIATSLLARGTFPETAAEFDQLAKLKHHKLDELLTLSGRAHRVGKPYHHSWQFLKDNWKPEVRYTRAGGKSAQDAQNMIEAVERLLKVL